MLDWLMVSSIIRLATGEFCKDGALQQENIAKEISGFTLEFWAALFRITGMMRGDSQLQRKTGKLRSASTEAGFTCQCQQHANYNRCIVLAVGIHQSWGTMELCQWWMGGEQHLCSCRAQCGSDSLYALSTAERGGWPVCLGLRLSTDIYIYMSASRLL